MKQKRRKRNKKKEKTTEIQLLNILSKKIYRLRSSVNLMIT
jgi:hypothetical protein